MSGARSDASTSTEEVPVRPLCLFYFTHPFGVLSPEPPRVFPAPPSLLLDMPPPHSPFYFTSTEESYRSSSPPMAPVVLSRRSPDLWMSSSSGEWCPGRRTLPPLHLPGPRDLPLYSPEVWSHRPPAPPTRFALPPLRLEAPPSPPASGGREPRPRRVHGVRKQRPRRADLRRLLACLMRRAVRGGGVSVGGESPALRDALHVLRDAWPEPRTSSYQCRIAERESPEEGETRPSAPAGMERRDASPGLLRRRYSAPETVMRKYRLAQLRADSSEETASWSRHTAASACASAPSCSPSESPARLVRRDRELMRKSALLRRMWARGAEPCACCAPRALSPSTFESHARPPSSCADTFTDTEECPSAPPPPPHAALPTDDRSFSDTDTISVSVCTAKETICSVDPVGRESSPPADRCESPVEEVSRGVEEVISLPYDTPLTVDTGPAYETLEVVVSETVSVPVPAPAAGGGDRPAPHPAPHPAPRLGPRLAHRDLNIDEYVSNILVESLNSLNDQLETMNASIGSDRKINIVEKEIKVKLQNTGVNTIVHLSPTSNNQIIFGNEELCNEVSKDECNNPRELLIRDEPESNNNIPCEGRFNALVPHDNNVNKAVLQQIQKLFQDELQHLDPEKDYSANSITHIEISNVDVYIDQENSAETKTEVAAEPSVMTSSEQVVSAVGAGNYYHDSHEPPVVPRFSAFPHTDSMEVNTSSSEDADIISECTSLVDSLEDPGSPRSGVRRRSVAPRRAALVRSAIDVLDLLPESARDPRDKGEAFFVRIKDDRCDCEQDHINVSEYMPDKIKQRLFRRHRKREMRMECARRGKIKQVKKELEMRRQEDFSRSRREIERECRGMVDALIDEIVAKIVQDEYKCMRIKQKNNKLKPAKSEDLQTKRNRRRASEVDHDESDCHCDTEKNNKITERNQIHGKMLARPSVASSGGHGPRRIYQKSEIHEGDKCIEILEILEYVNGSQSSPETTNSDDNQSQGSRRKSRIPVPVNEKSHHRQSKNECHMRLTGGDGRRAQEEQAGRALAGLLLHALGESRAPAPRADPRRFKRVFDVIPEERAASPAPPSPVRAPPAPPAPPARRTRSAATSPPAAPPPRSQTTMTEALTRSAATSPAPPLLREGNKENVTDPATKPERKQSEDRPSVTGEEAREARRPPRAPPAPAGDGRRHTPDDAPPPPVRPQKHEKYTKLWEKSRAGDGTSSDSGDSGGSLLCALAPRWLSAHARPRRRARRQPAPPPPPPRPSSTHPPQTPGWSVTVAGSCRAALPADLEMRLRFPPPCACAPPAAPPAPPAPPAPLTLALTKEVQDSSVVRCKSVRPSCEALPELETYRAARTKVKSSVKARRGYSLQWWGEGGRGRGARAARRADPLTVLGSAIVPEVKPRAPTMSERDLTRSYTPRQYLRSYNTHH